VKNPVTFMVVVVAGDQNHDFWLILASLLTMTSVSNLWKIPQSQKRYIINII
jgi:hypothetical protein